MALSVTPTSGAGPYTVTADISNTELIDGVDYRVYFGNLIGQGSCPERGNTPYNATITNELLENGSIQTSSTVPEGSCRTYTLEIIRVYDNAVVSASNVNVSNV